MNYQPDSMQRLLLLRLAVSDEGGEFLKHLESTISKQRRESLRRERLLNVTKRKADGRGRAITYLELTEQGWAWCHAHLAEPLGIRGVTPKLAVVLLEGLLGRLKNYFETHEQTPTLGKFIQQSGSRTRAPSQSGHGQASHLEEQLSCLCRELGNGRGNVRIRLADVRDRLPNVPRETLDELLLQMQRDGKLSLYSLDNPAEISSADHQAALRLSTGNVRHILYFGGTGS